MQSNRAGLAGPVGDHVPAPRWLSVITAAALASAAALCVWALVEMVRAPEDLVLTHVVDDAYYYVAVAEDLAEGRAPSFDDGLSVTTGFHPGFAFALAGLYRLLPDLNAWGQTRALLALSAAFHLLTAYALLILLRRLVRPTIAALAVALWLINPVTLSVLWEGVESGLYGFAIALVLLALSTILLRDSADSDGADREWRFAGRALGRAANVRSDAIVIALIAAVAALALRPRSRRRGKQVALMTGVAGLTFVPWLMYSYSLTGHLTQDSGTMKQLWREVKLAGAGLPGTVTFSLILMRRYLESAAAAMPGFDVLAALGLGVALAGRFNRLWHDRTPVRAGLLLSIFAAAAVLALAAAYGLFFDGFRPWYFMPAAVGAPLTVAVLLDLATTYLQQQGKLAIATMVMLLPLLAWPLYAENLHDTVTRPGRHLFSTETYQVAQWQRANTPEDARIGAFNAGIWAQFSERTVVNLDGLMNTDAVRASRERRLGEFIEDRVDYVLDYAYVEERLDAFAGPAWAAQHLTVERVFDVELVGTPLTLWRVEGSPPAALPQ